MAIYQFCVRVCPTEAAPEKNSHFAAYTSWTQFRCVPISAETNTTHVFSRLLNCDHFANTIFFRSRSRYVFDFGH